MQCHGLTLWPDGQVGKKRGFGGNFRQPLGWTTFRGGRSGDDRCSVAAPSGPAPARPTPTTRGIARRLYAAVRDLPIISPHGHVPAQWLADDIPFGDPTSLLITPDHYVNRLLHAHGVPLAELGVGGRPADAERVPGGVPDPVLALARVPRHTRPVLAGRELADIFGVHRPPVARRPPTRSTTRSPTASAEPDFRPRALLERFGIEVLATTDDPCDDLAAPRGARATTRPGDPGGADLPPRPLSRAAAAGLDRAESTALGEAAGIETGDYAGFVAALEDRRRYFIAHGAVSADHSHADARTDPLDQAEAERILRAGPRGAATPDRGHRAAPAPAAGDGPDVGRGRPGDDPAPGFHRNHHAPTFERVRRRRRLRHPGRRRVHRGAAAAAGALRHRTRTSSWCCSPSTRPCSPARSRRWPASTPACTRARPGGSSTPPRRSAATAPRSPRPPGSPGPPASSTTPARSAPSRPATTCPAGSTPATSPSWSPSTASTRTRRWTTAHDLVADQPEGGVQAVTAHDPTLRRLDRERDGRPRRPGADRPPRARQLLPRPPGLVHRARRRRRRLGHRRLHRTPRRRRPRLAAQDGLYTLIARAADGDRPEVVSAVSAVHRPSTTTGAAASPARSCAGDHHRHRGRLPARRRRRPGPRRPRGRRRRRRAARARRRRRRGHRPRQARRSASRRAARTACPGVAVVPCDNVPDNGAMVARVVGELAAAVDPDLAAWIARTSSFVTTMVDRITPHTTDDDREAVRALPGWTIRSRSSPSPSSSG